MAPLFFAKFTESIMEKTNRINVRIRVLREKSETDGSNPSLAIIFRKIYKDYNGETKLLGSSQTKIWKRGSNPHASLFIFRRIYICFNGRRNLIRKEEKGWN